MVIIDWASKDQAANVFCSVGSAEHRPTDSHDAIEHFHPRDQPTEILLSRGSLEIPAPRVCKRPCAREAMNSAWLLVQPLD